MNRLFLFLALISLGFYSTTQRQVATFDDGTEVEYEVVSDNSEDIKSLWMSWGGTFNGSMHGLGFDYWIPGKAKLDLSTSILGMSLLAPDEDSLYVDGTKPAFRPWRLRGHYVLSSKVKTKENKISLKSVDSGANERTVYVTNYDLPRTTYYCLHGGVGYQINGGVSYGEIAIGASLMRARNLDLQLFTGGKRGAKQQRGSSFMEVYADLLLFTNAAPFLQEYATELSEDGVDARPIGLEVAWRGMTTAGAKAGFGVFDKLGAGVGPYAAYVVGGFGFMFGLAE
ncbi:MAG: hypothetical protein ISP55_00230 [Flavobacteriales bacterium]|nr:hypothetical protein [Flavobacteriales bacterium]